MNVLERERCTTGGCGHQKAKGQWSSNRCASCYLVDLRSVCSIASAFISPTRTITKLVISTAMANGIQWQKSNRQRPKDSVQKTASECPIRRSIRPIHLSDQLIEILNLKNLFGASVHRANGRRINYAHT